MVIAVKSSDPAGNVTSVAQSLKDVEQGNGIRASGKTNYDNATVKQPFAFGEFKDLI